MSRLHQLHDAGVSIWLDMLSRDAAEQRRLRGPGPRLRGDGATSNPIIFAKAIRELMTASRPTPEAPS